MSLPLIAQPHCPQCAERIADLEEQVAFLRSELGLSTRITATGVFKRAFDLRPKETDVLMRLYEAYPRSVAKWTLSGEDAQPDTADVHVMRIRKKLGDPEAITTVWGLGYQLSPLGLDRVREVLDDAESAPAMTALLKGAVDTAVRKAEGVYQLTRVQREVLEDLGSGLRVVDIARKRGVTSAAVVRSRDAALRKLEDARL